MFSKKNKSKKVLTILSKEKVLTQKKWSIIRGLMHNLEEDQIQLITSEKGREK